MNKLILFPETKPTKTKQKEENIVTSHYTDNDDIPRKTKTEKEKHKRVITHTSKWRFTEEDLASDNQLNLLKTIQYTSIDCETKTENANQRCVLQQLNQKLAGYKAQDIAKNIYDPQLFVRRDGVIELLIASELKCHYCKKNIQVLYEYVREPLQWTLDRINNDYGHNDNNLLIACLSCNLRRKTIYHEKYEMTKQCTNVIKLS